MALKLKFRSLFPASVTAASPIILTKNGNAYAFSFDPSQAPTGPAGPAGATGAAGAGYGGTSATSLLIANSVTKVFTTQAGLAYQVGNYVRASSAAGGGNFMEGTISAYSGTSLSIAVTTIGGSGTFADWRFAVAGVPGTTGVASLGGALGVMTVSTGLGVVGQDLRVTNVPVANGGTGAANLVGFYSGLQAAKLTTTTISVNPGSFADSGGAAIYSTNAVLTADLTTATINTTPTPFVGGMLSGALSNAGATTDGTDVMLYLVKRNSDNKLALVGDSSNVYSASLNCVIVNGSASFSTGGPQTGFWNSTRVRLSSTGGFPAGFAINTDYYVVSETLGQNSTSFGLSATFGGAAITAGSTYTGQLSVKFGVQDHLDFIFGAGLWTVLRRVHFAFRWKWQWYSGSGGIPDFTQDPRSDRVYLTYGGSTSFAPTIPSSGTSTTEAKIDVSPYLSNLNRIALVRADIRSTGTAGSAYVYTPGAGVGSRPMGEGPTSGMTSNIGYAEVQTDSAGAISYNVGGGAKLQALYLEGWVFVDPS